MYRQSRLFVSLLLAAFFITACGDSGSDPVDPGAGSGPLTGTWYLVESVDVKFPLVLESDTDECQNLAEAQDYDYGYAQAALSEYWLTFKANGDVTQGAVFRNRCVLQRDNEVIPLDWSAETRTEDEAGFYQRSGNTLELFNWGADPDIDSPQLTGTIMDDRIALTPATPYSMFPVGIELVLKRR